MPHLLRLDHILIAGTCEYASLCDKKDFADIKDTEMGEIILDYPSGLNVIIRILIRGSHGDQSQ